MVLFKLTVFHLVQMRHNTYLQIVYFAVQIFYHMSTQLLFFLFGQWVIIHVTTIMLEKNWCARKRETNEASFTRPFTSQTNRQHQTTKMNKMKAGITLQLSWRWVYKAILDQKDKNSLLKLLWNHTSPGNVFLTILTNRHALLPPVESGRKKIRVWIDQRDQYSPSSWLIVFHIH